VPLKFTNEINALAFSKGWKLSANTDTGEGLCEKLQANQGAVLSVNPDICRKVRRHAGTTRCTLRRQHFSLTFNTRIAENAQSIPHACLQPGLSLTHTS
jgi:hypothetical protein